MRHPHVYWGIFPKERFFRKATLFLTTESYSWVSCKLDHSLKASNKIITHHAFSCPILWQIKFCMRKLFKCLKYRYRNFFLEHILAIGRGRKPTLLADKKHLHSCYSTLTSELQTVHIHVLVCISLGIYSINQKVDLKLKPYKISKK